MSVHPQLSSLLREHSILLFLPILSLRLSNVTNRMSVSFVRFVNVVNNIVSSTIGQSS
jgi:hypothetical protein